MQSLVEKLDFLQKPRPPAAKSLFAYRRRNSQALPRDICAYPNMNAHVRAPRLFECRPNSSLRPETACLYYEACQDHARHPRAFLPRVVRACVNLGNVLHHASSHF